MSTRLWCGIVTLVATLSWMAPVTAAAQARQRYPYETGQRTGAAYDNGYRAGLGNGERDGRAGRAYDHQRDGAYRRADSGYAGYGNRDSYRAAFRQGYVEGYRAGYARFGRSTGGWGYDPRGGYAQDPAFDRGYRDGYEEGRDAARDNDRYDPRREKDYRKASNGYKGRYGSRDYYQRSYREGFLSGYDRGYREARVYGGRWPW